MSRIHSNSAPICFTALLWLVACAGCTGLNAVDKPRDESFSKAAGYERSKEPSTSLPWGASSRSRDIERDLGVR